MFKDFKKVFRVFCFRNNRDALRFGLLLFVSSFIFASFPAVTQVYLRYIYPSNDVNKLVLLTVLFGLLFLFKLFLDIVLDKFSSKYYLKLQNHLREKVFYSLKDKKKNFVNNYDLLFFKVDKYKFFVQKIFVDNFRQLVTAISVVVLMIFFNFSLFVYVVWFVPVFLIYFWLYKKRLKSRSKKLEQVKKNKQELDLLRLLHRDDLKNSDKDFRRILSLHTQKELINRHNLVGLNQTLNSTIGFFRLLFLAYFGYAVITTGQSIEGLIVGLLFITIFVRSLIRILGNLVVFQITKKAVKEINKHID